MAGFPHARHDHAAGRIKYQLRGRCEAVAKRIGQQSKCLGFALNDTATGCQDGIMGHAAHLPYLVGEDINFRPSGQI